eukprot:2278482-Rhodomonas_salina.1
MHWVEPDGSRWLRLKVSNDRARGVSAQHSGEGLRGREVAVRAAGRVGGGREAARAGPESRPSTTPRVQTFNDPKSPDLQRPQERPLRLPPQLQGWRLRPQPHRREPVRILLASSEVCRVRGLKRGVWGAG